MREETNRVDCQLVVPCFRESKRLPSFLSDLLSTLKACRHQVNTVVVDDGSGPAEQLATRSIVESSALRFGIACHFLALETNRGKGGAIREGWDAAGEDVRMLAFIDADGSVAAATFVSLLDRALSEDDETVVTSSRRLPESHAHRSLWRRALSSVFYALVELRYGLGLTDTQCGCKIVSCSFYRRVASLLRQNGFGFDIELLRHAKALGVSIRELPIAWTERPGSTVTARDAVALYANVIFRRY